MSLIFIPWDIIFTKNNIWWFNDSYISGYKILQLPIEEWLFFLFIPFACVFIYEVLIYFIKKDILKHIARQFLGITSVALLIIGGIFYYRVYTSVTFISTGVACILLVMYNPVWLSRFLLSYFVSLVPFVNVFLDSSFHLQ